MVLRSSSRTLREDITPPAVLVEAVKEQQKQIDRIKNENRQLKLIAEHMDSLMPRVDQVETIRLAGTQTVNIKKTANR